MPTTTPAPPLGWIFRHAHDQGRLVCPHVRDGSFARRRRLYRQRTSRRAVRSLASLPPAYVWSARPDERGLAPCASAAVQSRRRSSGWPTPLDAPGGRADPQALSASRADQIAAARERRSRGRAGRRCARLLLGVARQLRQEGRHAASTEVEEPRPYRLDGDTCIWSYIDQTGRSHSVWSAPDAFIDAGYSSGTPSRMSTLRAHASAPPSPP